MAIQTLTAGGTTYFVGPQIITVTAAAIGAGFVVQTPSASGLPTTTNISAGSTQAFTLATTADSLQVKCTQATLTVSNDSASMVSGAGNLLTLAVANRGEVYIAAQATSGGRTRFKGRRLYTLRQAVTRVKLVFANRYITNSGETDGANAIGIVKCALEFGTTSIPVLFSAARSATVPVGSVAFESDWVTLTGKPGDQVYCRMSADVGASYPTENRGSGEQAMAYDPLNEVDDIDGIGVMTVPSGGAGIVPYHPVMIVGEVPVGSQAVFGVMDSIGAGIGDLGTSTPAGWGSSGGGFARRAFYAMGIPYTSCSLTGREIQDAATANTLMNAIAAYHTHAISEMGNNDINGGRTLATIQTNASIVWAALKGALKAPAWVAQSGILPRGTSTDACTTLANQTPLATFALGGVRDQLNVWYASRQQAGEINAYIDLAAAVADPTTPNKWAVRSYSSTLAAAATSVATSLSCAAMPAIGEQLVGDPGGGSQSTGYALVTAVAGTGPYTVTIESALGVAQASANIIKATASLDMTHPAPTEHIKLANVVKAEFPRR